MEEEIVDNQGEIKGGIANLLPYQWKKGQSGNPAGRPKGKTMKEYAKELLESQTEEERQAFLHGLPKEIIWKMAEGNPHSTSDAKVQLDVPQPINYVQRHDSIPENKSTE